LNHIGAEPEVIAFHGAKQLILGYRCLYTQGLFIVAQAFTKKFYCDFKEKEETPNFETAMLVHEHLYDDSLMLGK
jgi:hypothetical protein